MALDVREAKAWISRSAIGTGGSTQGPAQKTASDGESEVDRSGGDPDEVPPSPGLSGPKVHAQDLEDVVLDKGAWAATPGVRQGWRIFVGVSPSPYFLSSFVLTPLDRAIWHGASRSANGVPSSGTPVRAWPIGCVADACATTRCVKRWLWTVSSLLTSDFPILK